MIDLEHAKRAAKSMLKLFVSLSITLLIFLIWPSLAYAKMPVAVVNLEAEGIPPKIARDVSDGLRARLCRHFTLLVREEKIQKKILEELFFQLSDLVQEAVKMGRVLGAQKMILNRIAPVQGLDAISLRLYIVDVEEARYDLIESAEVIPCNRLERALDCIAGIVIAQIPLRGEIIRVTGDTVDVNLGCTDGLTENAELEVLRGSEIGEIAVGALQVIERGSRSSTAKVKQRKEDLEVGDIVEMEIDVDEAPKLRKELTRMASEELQRLLEELRKEREKLKEEKEKKLREEWEKLEEERKGLEEKEEELRKKWEMIEKRERQLKEEWEKLEKSKRRMKERLGTSKLKLGVGYFVPADREFKDDFYGDTEFNLENPVYSVAYHPGSHHYFKTYLKVSYLKRKTIKETILEDDVKERTIISGNVGARVQIPLEILPELSFMPYGGAGGEFSYVIDKREVGEKSFSGWGYEAFLGLELVYYNEVGIFLERVHSSAKAGKQRMEIGGGSIVLGLDFWF